MTAPVDWTFLGGCIPVPRALPSGSGRRYALAQEATGTQPGPRSTFVEIFFLHIFLILGFFLCFCFFGEPPHFECTWCAHYWTPRGVTFIWAPTRSVSVSGDFFRGCALFLHHIFGPSGMTHIWALRIFLAFRTQMGGFPRANGIFPANPRFPASDPWPRGSC